MRTTGPASGNQRRAKLIALACGGLVVSMVALAFAAVPLYRLFCQVTGYGGTTQVADAVPEASGERMFTIRFDANVNGIPWDFRPVEPSMRVRVGESALAYYRATNQSAAATTGTAVFNVTPIAAGQYFAKVDCFCFEEQKLAAGAEADLPVSFFVDPAIEDDPDLRTVSTITLSYTFFPARPARLDETAAAGQAEIN